MKNLQLMMDTLHNEAKIHAKDTFNYVIPESWNHYGFPYTRKLKNKQLIVNPYAFYAYTLQAILKSGSKEVEPAQDRSWIKKATIYSIMVRSVSAWDHDRDDVIHHDNLYHMRDNGTFLKCIALLPLWKRMGINTILLHQPFALAKSSKAHDYACKEAVIDFQKIDDCLGDPLVKGMDVEKQFAAFSEACHFLGIRVILEYCPAKMARYNAYMLKHPDWFYWIDESYEKTYHPPVCHGLPQNSVPYEYTLKDLYHSEDVKQHIEKFKTINKGTTYKTMEELRATHHVVSAPSIVDQINANIEADVDTTILRFYEDRTYMLQDSIRCDLYPGKKAIRACWNQLAKNITWYQKKFHIDGIYLEQPHLLPEKLHRELAQVARIERNDFVMIAEDTQMEHSASWVEKGYDMMSGQSGYEESQLWEFKFHSFAYRLKSAACPMFCASEFYDSRRISCLAQGKQLAIMLSVMNHFLPNGVPMLMNGIESFDVQPMQLSPYGDMSYINSLPKEDRRYRQQSYIDQYYFDYCHPDLSLLPNILEVIQSIRKRYIDAICDLDHCIPVWFDSPQDPGIGFTFIKQESALMVVCNVNVNEEKTLHIHSDNLLVNLPFHYTSIKQLYSTKDPYTQVYTLDALQQLPLTFAPGEVKFIEFS